MRHLKAGKRLGVTTSHRKAMMRNLVTSLLEHGEIKTTITKAKEMRKYLDKMIGLAKRGDLHARRQALSFVKSKDVVGRLFDEFGTLYKDRSGGYTRIYRTGFRLGDNAEMALIQMVDLERKSSSKKDSVSEETIKEVKSELETVDQEQKEAPLKAEENLEQNETEQAKPKKITTKVKMAVDKGDVERVTADEPKSETKTSSGKK